MVKTLAPVKEFDVAYYAKTHAVKAVKILLHLRRLVLV